LYTCSTQCKNNKVIFCNTRHYFGDFFVFNIRTPFSAQTLPIPNLHSLHRLPTINYFTLLGRSLKSSHLVAAADVITCTVLLPACVRARKTRLEKARSRMNKLLTGVQNFSCLFPYLPYSSHNVGWAGGPGIFCPRWQTPPSLCPSTRRRGTLTNVGQGPVIFCARWRTHQYTRRRGLKPPPLFLYI